MSHWTKSAVEIKNLDLIQQVAEEMNLKVQRGENLKFSSSYAGTVDAKMILTDSKGGQVAIVVDNAENGTYKTISDDYHNSITSIVGKNCSKLGQEYTIAVVKQQAMGMGAIVASHNVQKDGSVELRLSL